MPRTSHTQKCHEIFLVRFRSFLSSLTHTLPSRVFSEKQNSELLNGLNEIKVQWHSTANTATTIQYIQGCYGLGIFNGHRFSFSIALSLLACAWIFSLCFCWIPEEIEPAFFSLQMRCYCFHFIGNCCYFVFASSSTLHRIIKLRMVLWFEFLELHSGRWFFSLIYRNTHKYIRIYTIEMLSAGVVQSDTLHIAHYKCVLVCWLLV